MHNLKTFAYTNYLSCLAGTLLNFVFNKILRMTFLKHNLTISFSNVTYYVKKSKFKTFKQMNI